LERLGVEADECLFVGDDPIWDVVGPEALGMETILIDRTGRDINAIHGLDEIFDELDEPTYS
jgi:FMN phosphatase YigB (HAD superfamily)